jgi:hypothetical protein
VQHYGYRKRLWPLVAAALTTGSPALVGAAAEPSYEELKAEVELLRSRLASGQASRPAESLDRPFTSADVDATVSGVITDADRRSHLIADTRAAVAGWDNGFFIRSDDGNFSIKPGVQAQFRNVTTFREDAKQDGEDNDSKNAFEYRRLRFRFDGNAFSPDLTYSFVWDVNRSGGGVSLLDAWANWRFSGPWNVKLGQFKDPAHHELLVSGFSQLAVERTLVNQLLGGGLTDRVQGVGLVYGGYAKDNPLYGEVTFHDGANSKNTDFRDTVPNADTTLPPTFQANFGFAGRVEFKLFGDWKDFRDYTAKGAKQDLLVIGAGADWTQRDGSDQYLGSVDVQWETPGGLSAYAALYTRNIGLRNGSGDDSRFDWGAQAQLGYLFTKQWEAFGRYDVTFLDNDFVSGEDTFHELTVGVNYYLGPNGAWGHRAKLTLDVVYLPNGSPSDQTGLGILAGAEDQFVLRGQFQIQI